MICQTCAERLAWEGHDECYRCHVKGIGFTFRGGGHMYGRASFSERTNAEFVAEHVGDTTGLAHLGSQEWQG